MTNHEKARQIADMLMRKEIYTNVICVPPMQDSHEHTLKILTEDIEEILDTIDEAKPLSNPLPQDEPEIAY